jgi:hypothetical protein
MKAYEKLTRSSLPYLLCRDSENIQYFHHNLHDDVRHRRGWWNLRIRLEAFEKVLYSFKDVDQGLLRCTDILGRLHRCQTRLKLERNGVKYEPGEGPQHLRRSLLRVRKPT